MNLKMKDIIAIAVVMCISFPILYVAILFLTGTARVEFGEKKDESAKQQRIEKVPQSFRRDSLAALNSKTFLALQQERAELKKERNRLLAQQERTDMLHAEIEMKRKGLEQERLKLEELVEKSSGLSGERERELSKLYGAMKPAEAAAIIETLNDDLALRILVSINDDRQKGRILSLLSKAKASRLSRMLGAPLLR